MRIFDPPILVEPAHIRQVWHERTEKAEGCRFFRELVRLAGSSAEHDLWETLHPVPALLYRWRDDGERELMMSIDEYDEKSPGPRLRVIYVEALQHGPA